ncbi:hypothetical protein [Streptomyces sp. NBC_01244]|uniref:hypothetical protein n=1 Tax=Streptomyces sp. NBC_01244 TaxID=2903797 RepID=UPI002E15FE32|nr:hypothetical protein OG247_00040 [Streptomyces sp. NBC_01244]
MAAPEGAPHDVGLYAEKIMEQVPGRTPLELWEHVARSGTIAVYSAMRSLPAAVLTARAAASLPNRDEHLEGLRSHWLVDWIIDCDQVRPSGPACHPQLLAALVKAVGAQGQVEYRERSDGELLARLWEVVAGPGPDDGRLTRRQIAGQPLLLVDLEDPYVQDRARTVPTWSPSVLDTEQVALAILPGELQQRVQALLSPQDYAVLCAYCLGVLITSVVDTWQVLNMAKTSGVVGAV